MKQSSYFFLHVEPTEKNLNFLKALSQLAHDKKQLIYIVNGPLADLKYEYAYDEAVIVLSPGYKIAIVNHGSDYTQFESYVEDVIEDLGSLSDRYLYKDNIGRPRAWRNRLIDSNLKLDLAYSDNGFFSELKITDPADKRKIELLISLFTGSINDIGRVKADVPETTLDKVKRKIQLFDGDQTRFIYEPPKKKRITIQGLSGTGKTELLLHKLKDLYITDNKSKLFFTCHNKILADNLKNRIPSFFNFMKVEQQIEWEARLWCRNAWGSGSDVNSGAYRYICGFYSVEFSPYTPINTFSRLCEKAYNQILEKSGIQEIGFAFDYMFIDESQDFDENFFKLCELVTKNNIYIAGDIFQSIFDEKITSIVNPDYLLGKCYRTDPKTLMFAHALGMGLFEKNKLRWLAKKEWEDCGYSVEDHRGETYHLSREPLRRFEDIDENYPSIEIVETDDLVSSALQCIETIRQENETVSPDDIGIIFLDSGKSIFESSNLLEYQIYTKYKWQVNKAYETKATTANRVLISNRNNVKGLEFPFVICITNRLQLGPSYRNSVYTMLTRSFIKSYFITANQKSGLTSEMKEGLKGIMIDKEMVVKVPSLEEQDKIRTRFKQTVRNVSHYEVMTDIFTKLGVVTKYHDKIISTSRTYDLVGADESTLISFVQDQLKYAK